MKYEISEIDNVLIISPRGRMDSYSTIEIEKKINSTLLKNKESDIIFNFEDVEYISSIGMRVIYSTIQLLEEFNRRLKICSLNHATRTIFENLKIMSMFDLYESKKEAISSCKSS
jgi:anti-sigma B factor antagonist